MTVSVAWIQKFADTEELVFVSDSRFTGGYKWDTAQKIIPLPGLNCVISFAGDTSLALPVVNQIVSSCANFHQTRTGAIDARQALTHILNILNSMRDDFANVVSGLQEDMDRATSIIFGGYSFKRRELCLWRVVYDFHSRKFIARSPENWSEDDGRKSICLIGDYRKEYLERLGRAAWNTPYFRMEPLQVLIDMLRDGEHGAIGGSPQMVKVYMHRNYLPFGFFWDHKGAQKVHLFGRPLLAYEKTTFPIVDPNDLRVRYPLRSISNALPDGEVGDSSDVEGEELPELP